MLARRALIVGALGVLAGSRAAEAQPARVYQVGVVIQGGSAYYLAVDGFRDGLRELGLEDGKQLVLHVRDAKGDLKAVEAAALLTHRVMGLRDLSRIDIIVAADGTPNVIDINVAPGLTEVSLFPQAVAAAGLELGELYREIIIAAAERA